MISGRSDSGLAWRTSCSWESGLDHGSFERRGDKWRVTYSAGTVDEVR